MTNGNELLTGTGTVLIVDDDPINRRIMQEILNRLGYSVEQAQDGQSCLDFLSERASEINVIILDVIMPGLSGLEIIERLQKMTKLPPVLLMSGVPLEDDLERFVDNEKTFYVQKPVNLKNLSELMHKLTSLKYC